MRVQSPLTPRGYISAMKEHMESHFLFGEERLTGFFLWRFFYVTHHAAAKYRYRAIHAPKNAAMGFVRKRGEGCEIRCIRFQSALCPLVFLFFLCAFIVLSIYSPLWNHLALSTRILIGAGIAVIYAPIHTFVEIVTNDLCEDGRRTLISFLLDPSDPYANYSKTR